MPIGFLWESQKERDHYEDQDVVGGNIKIVLRAIGWDGMDCVHLSEDMD
jgi:hypothetical protein